VVPVAGGLPQPRVVNVWRHDLEDVRVIILVRCQFPGRSFPEQLFPEKSA
jgi:hypothetical protein